MKTTTLDEEIIALLEGLSPTDNISLNSCLTEDLGFDSLNMVELLVKLEENYSIELNESDMNTEKLQTVLDVIKLLSKYVSMEK